jgi:membrane-associated protease RseP (regulator of RpoE activity)
MDNLRIEAGKRATLTLTNLGVGVVKGTVRDEKTGEPVAGLRCWMTGQSPDRRAPPTTDAAGSFTLESAPGGMHDLTCYGPQRYASQQITVRPGSVLTVELLARDTSKPRTEGESGMTLDTLQNDVIVATVAAGGPAARAGVKPGDILTAIDGKKLDGRARIAELAIERRAPGTKVKLGLERDDKELTVELTLDAASP